MPVFCAIVWLGCFKLIPDILYWPTGGWYSVLNLLVLAWLYHFRKALLRQSFSARSYVFIFLLSVVCGMNSHNAIPAMVLAAVMEAWNLWRIKNKPGVRYALISLCGLLISASVVYFSPGDRIRLQAASFRGVEDGILYNLMMVLVKYGYWFSLFIIFLIGFLYLSSKNPSPFVARLRQHLRKKPSDLIYRHRMLLAACSTLLVFGGTSFFAMPRTGIFFVSFMMIWICSLVSPAAGFRTGSCYVALTAFLLVISGQISKTHSLREQLRQREVIFQLSKGRDVTVREIPAQEIPFAFVFTDLSSDSAGWVNRCMAGHYGLKTVRAIPDR